MYSVEREPLPTTLDTDQDSLCPENRGSERGNPIPVFAPKRCEDCGSALAHTSIVLMLAAAKNPLVSLTPHEPVLLSGLVYFSRTILAARNGEGLPLHIMQSFVLERASIGTDFQAQACENIQNSHARYDAGSLYPVRLKDSFGHTTTSGFRESYLREASVIMCAVFVLEVLHPCNPLAALTRLPYVPYRWDAPLALHCLPSTRGCPGFYVQASRPLVGGPRIRTMLRSFHVSGGCGPWWDTFPTSLDTVFSSILCPRK